MSLSTKLKYLRNRDGRSFQDIADATGVSKAYIFGLVKGDRTNPPHDTLVRLAGYFRTSVSDLIGEDPNAFGECPELVALYRDLKSLSDADRKTVEAVVRSLKER